jgi:hypothetical protein
LNRYNYIPIPQAVLHLQTTIHNQKVNITSPYLPLHTNVQLKDNKFELSILPIKSKYIFDLQGQLEGIAHE